MKSNHTPGPWGIRSLQSEGHDIGYTDDLQIATAPDSDGFGVPVAMVCYNGKDQREANARLIAAAPDLLAVAIELEESAAYWSEYDVPIGIVDRIRAAIAKAMGE